MDEISFFIRGLQTHLKSLRRTCSTGLGLTFAFVCVVVGSRCSSREVTNEPPEGRKKVRTKIVLT